MNTKLKKKVLIDMTASIIHNGHVRLINKASKFGSVIIALTTDSEVKKHKNFIPELKYKLRKEILLAFKNVSKVIPCKYEITQNFVDRHKIDIVVQGSDYANRKFRNKTITFNRTKNISSNIIRQLAAKNIKHTGKKLKRLNK